MKAYKIILSIICAFVAVATIVAAIVIFRNEIADFFVDIKARIDEKRLQRNGEYADFADV